MAAKSGNEVYHGWVDTMSLFTTAKKSASLAKKPAEIISCASGHPNNCVTDDYIYRTIVVGVIGASNIHVAAVKQSLTNDRMRKFFIQLLRSEIDIFDNFITYGKLKGYLHEPPQYSSKI